MPYIRIPPDVFLEHNGVEVFHTYRSGTDEPWNYWFTANPDTADDEGHPAHFDARMFVGRWSQTPTVHDWDGWWTPRFKTENDAICALIRTAIEEGKITAVTTGKRAET